MVDGLPARVQEVEITERNIAFAPGDRITEYVVELPDGAYLVAATYLGPDYGSARSVLDDMMRTMQIWLPYRDTAPGFMDRIGQRNWNRRLTAPPQSGWPTAREAPAIKPGVRPGRSREAPSSRLRSCP